MLIFGYNNLSAQRTLAAFKQKQRALAAQASELAALYHRLKGIAWQVMSFSDRSTADQARVIVELIILSERLERYLVRAIWTKEQEQQQDKGLVKEDLVLLDV
jgi:hypothetical protein